jgi:Na+-translocating ferredoxin:NAD+ oxidoreductase RnfC subunit
MSACVRCGCTEGSGDDAHRIVAALVVDNVDAAIEAGLLDDVACSACTPQCREALMHARDERQRALAARERYRDRALRLARRQRERDAARAPVQQDASKPALPPAAAAALARAKARAAGRQP